MVFSSISFLFLFFPIVFLIYFLVRSELRNFILLIASIIFYIWEGTNFIAVIAVSILINYLFGLLIDYLQVKKFKLIYHKIIIFFSVLLNIGILVYFKYFNFLVENYNFISTKLNWDSIQLEKVISPIGISFYTFHGLSYVIDIYRNKARAQRNLLNLMLYILFFPQLIAGPIIRYHDIESQLTNRQLNIENISYGIRRFIIGLSKKVIIANSMGEIADQIFGLSHLYLTLPLSWLGIITYSLQIYYDFSGYSDMAIGIAKIFGFTFLENFNYPYISKSIQEFWKRWHISLSNWFKDYLYIPLGGNRKGSFKTYRNLLIVFLCTGVWHGASWNFVVWGVYYGLFLILERVGLFKFKSKYFSHIYTILVVLTGWVFFRSDNILSALNYLGTMIGIIHGKELYSISFFISWKFTLLFIFAILGCTPLISKKFLKLNHDSFNKIHIISREIYIILLLGISILFMSNMTYNPFIYFRF